MNQTGLVLQGGGVRGIYTSGVIDCFLDHGIHFPYITAVSAGACNATALITRQRGYGRSLHLDFLHDPRYLSWWNWIREGSLFGMDFIFDDIPRKLCPFDYERFASSREELVIGATDCQTGEPVYFRKGDCDDIFLVLRASCSIPFLSRTVEFQGRQLLDGGISDPIPIGRAEGDGYAYNVVVMTDHRPTPRETQSWGWLIQWWYRQYPLFARTLLEHSQRFRDTLRLIQQRYRQRRAFVLRPSRQISVTGLGRDIHKLTQLYELGYQDTWRQLPDLLQWMEEPRQRLDRMGFSAEPEFSPIPLRSPKGEEHIERGGPVP